MQDILGGRRGREVCVGVGVDTGLLFGVSAEGIDFEMKKLIMVSLALEVDTIWVTESIGQKFTVLPRM